MADSEIKNVLVTGAKGMFGSDLVLVLKKSGFNVIPTDVEDLDITNEKEVKEFFAVNDIDIVIHSAAYTNVDKAEEELDKAILVNAIGTENLAKASLQKSIPIVYISTDYVFDGTKEGVYTSDDPTCPINNYGLSKLKGEQAIQENNPEHYIARTSWLYGINGKNFVETMIRIANDNNEIKVVDDQKGCPTWTMALAEAVVNLIKDNKPYGIYHTCGSGETTWWGFAKKIIELMKIDTIVTPVTSDQFPRPAKRPENSVMENNNICPHWEDSLKEYLSLRGK